MTTYLSLYTGPGGPLCAVRESITNWPMDEHDIEGALYLKDAGSKLQGLTPEQLEARGYVLVCRLEHDALYECPERAGVLR